MHLVHHDGQLRLMSNPVHIPADGACTQCKHRLEGVPPNRGFVVCPECGTTFDAWTKEA